MLTCDICEGIFVDTINYGSVLVNQSMYVKCVYVKSDLSPYWIVSFDNSDSYTVFVIFGRYLLINYK